MKKAFLVSLGIAALVGAGCAASTSNPPSPSDLQTPPPPSDQQTMLTPPVFDNIVTSSTEGRLHINVKTPQMTDGLTLNMRNTFNQRLVSDAQQQINQFKTDFSDPNNTDPRGNQAPPWELDSQYTIVTSTGRIQSVLVDSYQYTGGAHGMTSEAAYMFDLKNGSFLSLADLFEPGTDYLSQLSTSTRAVLMNREYVKDDAQWVGEGTAASSTNFGIVYALPEGLAVYFSDYQVAAHAIGPQIVVIPWTQLTGVKQEYLPQ